MGSLGTVVAAVPIFTRANVAVENVYGLENQLDKASKTFDEVDRKPARKEESFSEIRFDNVVFHYTDKDGTPVFTVGPINMSIKQGENLFIVGGNGSGKSTFLKLLTGLYYPVSGGIILDDSYVEKATYSEYRGLFSIIFGDFYLFDRLYGLDIINHKKVDELLRLMELDEKTEVIDNVITNINLSNGQRKRLAMIVALLEDRKIYVFDEWEAGQDPEFRKYFFEVLLKDLQSQGKTIVCVTHDDRYFDCADRVLKMEFGRFIE